MEREWARWGKGGFGKVLLEYNRWLGFTWTCGWKPAHGKNIKAWRGVEEGDDGKKPEHSVFRGAGRRGCAGFWGSGEIPEDFFRIRWDFSHGYTIALASDADIPARLSESRQHAMNGGLTGQEAGRRIFACKDYVAYEV